MRKILVLGLMVMGFASAKSISLPTLLLNNDYESSTIRYSSGYVLFYLTQPTQSKIPLVTEVSYFGDEDNALGGYDSIRLVVDKPFLFAGDLKVIKSNAYRIAEQCFNLSTSRRKEIDNYLDRFNQLPLLDKAVMIGPMKMIFHRFSYRTDLQPFTLILFSRDGVPGEAPWLNYCTR